MDSFMSIDSKILIHRQIPCNTEISIIYRRNGILHSPIYITEIEYIINFPPEKTPDPDNLTRKFYLTFKEDNTTPIQNLPEFRGDQHYTDTKS